MEGGGVIATNEIGAGAWFKDPDGNVLGIFQPPS